MLRFIYVCTQNAVRYAIIESIPFDGTSFFYISPEGGQVSVVRPLTETTQDSFTVSPAPVLLIALSVLLQSCSSLCLSFPNPAHRFVCPAPVLLFVLSVCLAPVLLIALSVCPAQVLLIALCVCPAPVLFIAMSVLLFHSQHSVYCNARSVCVCLTIPHS